MEDTPAGRPVLGFSYSCSSPDSIRKLVHPPPASLTGRRTPSGHRLKKEGETACSWCDNTQFGGLSPEAMHPDGQRLQSYSACDPTSTEPGHDRASASKTSRKRRSHAVCRRHLMSATGSLLVTHRRRAGSAHVHDLRRLGVVGRTWLAPASSCSLFFDGQSPLQRTVLADLLPTAVAAQQPLRPLRQDATDLPPHPLDPGDQHAFVARSGKTPSSGITTRRRVLASRREVLPR